MKAETDQFIDGLNVLGIVQMAKKYPQLMKPLFIPTENQINKGNPFILTHDSHTYILCIKLM